MPKLLRPADLLARQLAPQLVGCTIEEVERELILSTLGATSGCRTHAADVLGISIRTLRNRLKDYRTAGALIPPSIRSAA